MNEQEKKLLHLERQRQKKKLAEGAKIVDPVVKVKFQNIEDPPIPGRPAPPFEFCFQSPRGSILSFRVSRSEEVPDTALRHGEVYELPLSVVNHLNSVQSPIYSQKTVVDPITGAPKIINFIAGYRNRFACTPVDMTNFQVIDQEEQRKGPGRPSKKDEQAVTNKELASMANA